MMTMEGAWITVFMALLALATCGYDGEEQMTFPDVGGDLGDDPLTDTNDELSVRMFFNTTCERYLNDQIGEELKASHVYLSMAYYFSRDSVALYGFHKFFKKMSDEERGHGQMLMEYMNKRGGTIKMESPLSFQHKEQLESGNWTGALHAMKIAMHLEHHVYKHLKRKVHQCAIDHNDPHLQDYIESKFLTEQVDSIKEIGDYITKIKRLGHHVGLHMFDKELEEKF